MSVNGEVRCFYMCVTCLAFDVSSVSYSHHLHTKSFCSTGVACWGTNDNKNGCMDQIDFENDGLSGSLIPEMHKLDQLRFFILEQGSVAGKIPTEYGLFEKLLIFDMDFNDLTGNIPDELFNMNLLQQLDLNDNELSGPISPNIGNMRTLTFLQLDHNELSGNIPTEMGELKALREWPLLICVFKLHCLHNTLSRDSDFILCKLSRDSDIYLHLHFHIQALHFSMIMI